MVLPGRVCISGGSKVGKNLMDNKRFDDKFPVLIKFQNVCRRPCKKGFGEQCSHYQVQQALKIDQKMPGLSIVIIYEWKP